MCPYAQRVRLPSRAIVGVPMQGLVAHKAGLSGRGVTGHDSQVRRDDHDDSLNEDGKGGSVAFGRAWSGLVCEWSVGGGGCGCGGTGEMRCVRRHISRLRPSAVGDMSSLAGRTVWKREFSPLFCRRMLFLFFTFKGECRFACKDTMHHVESKDVGGLSRGC